MTVTNFLGVMMDFTWKQPPRADDADNPLRAVFAAPTAQLHRRRVHEAVRHRGVRRGVRPHRDLARRSCRRTASDRPDGAAGLRASDWFDIRLVDPETDEEVPVGEVGELVVRPKHPWTCSLGYYGMPEKTVEAWRNLWFHTGDALRRDEDGWYYFVDRYKDALRRRGENISSYEVEQAILWHAACVECAVVGVAAEQEAGEDEVLAMRRRHRAGRAGRDLGAAARAGSRRSRSRGSCASSTRCPRRPRRRCARRSCAIRDHRGHPRPATRHDRAR